MPRHQVKVGCAGWSIPRQHAHLFGPGESLLSRYASRFSVVEINSSFYRPHQRATYERWADTVPRQFRFSVKIPRTISHELGLRAAGPALDQLLTECEGLGAKLGGFLLQLPPSLVLDARVASAFLRGFRHRSDAPLVCEPRHASWFTTQADALLERYEVARARVDPVPAPAAAGPGEDRVWPYWRWHGSPRIYYSAYSEQELVALAAKVSTQRQATNAPWVIFDNTAHGFAAANAARLQDLLQAASPSTKPAKERKKARE